MISPMDSWPTCAARPESRHPGATSEVTSSGVAAVRSLPTCCAQKLQAPVAREMQLGGLEDGSKKHCGSGPWD